MLGERVRLDKHASRAATWIEDVAFGRFQHRYQGFDDTERGKIFASAFAFGIRELANEIFIDAPQHIDTAGFGTKGIHRKKVDQARQFFPCRDLNPRRWAGAGPSEFGKSFFQQRHDVIESQFDIIRARDFYDFHPSELPFGTRKTFFFLKLSGSSRISRASCLSVVNRSL